MAKIYNPEVNQVFIEDNNSCYMVLLEELKVSQNVNIEKYDIRSSEVVVIASIDNYGYNKETVSGYCVIKCNMVIGYINNEYCENYEPLELRLDLGWLENPSQLHIDELKHLAQAVFS